MPPRTQQSFVRCGIHQNTHQRDEVPAFSLNVTSNKGHTMSKLFISNVIISCSLSGESKQLTFDTVYDCEENGTVLIPRAGLTIRELSLDYPLIDGYDALRELLPDSVSHYGYSAISVGFYDHNGHKITVDEVRVDIEDLETSEGYFHQEIPCGLRLEGLAR